MKRIEIQKRLAKAMTIVEDPAAVFCIESFASVEGDSGERLGRLLARLISDPDRTCLVATTNAFVFAFGDQLGGKENRPIKKIEEATTPSSEASIHPRQTIQHLNHRI